MLIRISRILLALSMVSAAYGKLTFPDYPVSAAGEYAVSTEVGGLTIGVKAIDNLKEQRTYFQTELSYLGFVPVFVVIRNGSNTESFLFDKTKIIYGPDSLSISTPKTGTRGPDALAASVIPYIGLYTSVKIVSNAAQIQQNVLIKEMKSTTLSPGTSIHGFLYIPVPKDAARKKLRLQIPITKSGTDESIVLDLVF
jgi:hypothetical protein